jgi:hypothetical protein
MIVDITVCWSSKSIYRKEEENRQDAFGPLNFQRWRSLLVIGPCLLINLCSTLNNFMFIIHYSDPGPLVQTSDVSGCYKSVIPKLVVKKKVIPKFDYIAFLLK